MAWIALFSASLILGGVSACPARRHIAGAETYSSAVGACGQTAAPSVVPLRIHGWSAGRDSITLGNAPSLLLSILWPDVDAPLRCPI
jgi:hypothetical protein